MSFRNRIRTAACLTVAFCSWNSLIAQTSLSRDREAPATLTQFVPSRVVEAVDDARLVSLPGNTHFLARAQFDQGPVDQQLPLERMILALKRSPEQEAALDKFLTEQSDPKSPNFHHWLHAEEFGRLYGPSDSDIAAITNWLQNHGFRIDSVAKGRTNI